MRRGQHSLFNSMFDDDSICVAVPAPTVRRGRSEVLIEKRNDLLVHRYFFYVKILGRQYEKTLQILESELFIAQHTIVNVMTQDKTLLKELNSAKPSVRYFKEKYPFINWEIKSQS
jgi:hypothetical protein